MPEETLSTLDKALKTYFKGTIISQLDEGSGPVMAALEKTGEYIVGNAFKFPLEYGRSGGVGARTEDGDLPTPSARHYEQGTAVSKNLYARFSLTDKLIRTSKDSKASFANQVTRMMQNLVTDGNDMLRRNLVGTSLGVMGVVSADVTAAKVVTVVGTIDAFYPGQLVDILTAPSTKSVDAAEIVDVDFEANTISFAANVTVTQGQLITLAGNYGLELTGIEDIMTTETIYGINRANNKWFKPIVYDKYVGGVAQDIDSLWMQKAIDEISKRTGEKPNFITCTDGVQRGYIDEQNTYKRNTEYKKVDGGYSLIFYNDVAISPEKYATKEIMDFLSTKNMVLGRLADWDWLSADGSIMHRISGKPAYEGTLVEYAELLCTKPASNSRIKGIKEY